MPFRQTARLPHEQNKKTERELVLKRAPRKRQQQQRQWPNYKFHFLGCTATLGSTGVPGALSLPHRAQLWRCAFPICKPSGKMDLGVPLPPSWALLLPEQRHSMVLLSRPLALLFPSCCYTFSDEFIGGKFCDGRCQVWEHFGKNLQCQFNNLNYAR